MAVGKPLLAMMDPRSPYRNLSSASQQTRQKMRECHGLVDSMIHYVNSSLEVGKSEDKVSPGNWVLGGFGCPQTGCCSLPPGGCLAIVVQRCVLMQWWENQPGSIWA